MEGQVDFSGDASGAGALSRRFPSPREDHLWVLLHAQRWVCSGDRRSRKTIRPNWFSFCRQTFFALESESDGIRYAPGSLCKSRVETGKRVRTVA